MVAADSQAQANGTAYTTRKLYRANGAVIGVSGCLDNMLMFVHWYAAGADLSDRPKGIDGTALVLDRSGIWRYESECYPIPILDPFAAIGSGTDAALAAMHLGENPANAVYVACKVDVHSAVPVEVETL